MADVASQGSQEKTDHQRILDLETDVRQIRDGVGELLGIFKGAKTGVRIIIFLGYVAKWVGGVALGIAAVWALLNSIKTGVPPSINN